MATSFINLKALSKRIEEVREELAQLLHLQSFSTAGSARKRGRPAKNQAGHITGNAKAPSKRGRRTGKRGRVGNKILEFLRTKGKEGAHVKEIAAHVGTKPANVTAWTYTTGKGKVKRVKPATFTIKD